MLSPSQWVPPRCQDRAIPLAACCTALVEGSQPLKMISFRWSHIAHSVAKMVCHSASRRKDPWQIDCQKASPAVTSISPRAAAVHTGWTSGHSTNKWEQSSVAPEHITHPSSASGTKRCRKERCRKKVVELLKPLFQQLNDQTFQQLKNCTLIAQKTKD